jgi:hypothetical protein
MLAMIPNAVTRHVLLLALITALGCGAPVFENERLLIEARNLPYPVMVSRATRRGGRQVTAETRLFASDITYTGGFRSGSVAVTTAERVVTNIESEHSMAAQIGRQMGAGDRWVQIEDAAFTATDSSGPHHESSDRLMRLRATVHRW